MSFASTAAQIGDQLLVVHRLEARVGHTPIVAPASDSSRQTLRRLGGPTVPRPDGAIRLCGMGMYFKLAPGVRVRVTRHGVRTALGPRAARVHVGGGYRSGISTGAGPITLYHGVGGSKRRRSRSAGTASRSSGPSRATVAAYQRQAAAAAKSTEAAQIAAALLSLATLHREAFDPVTPPVAPDPVPVDEAAVLRRHMTAAVKGIGFWKRSERQAAREQARSAAESEISATRAEFEAGRARIQAELDERWAELLANQPDVVLATLAEAFEDNEAHAAAVSVDGSEVSVAVFVPGPEIIPERVPSRTQAGNLSLKKMTQSESAGYYRTAVCGHVLATVKEALAVAPGLSSVRVAAVRLSAPDVYGRSHLECLAAATFSRAALDGVDWEHAESTDVFDQCATDVSVNMSGRVKHLEPLDLTGEPELAALVAAVDVED